MYVNIFPVVWSYSNNYFSHGVLFINDQTVFGILVVPTTIGFLFYYLVPIVQNLLIRLVS